MQYFKVVKGMKKEYIHGICVLAGNDDVFFIDVSKLTSETIIHYYAELPP